MKKIWLSAVAMFILISFSSIAFAEIYKIVKNGEKVISVTEGPSETVTNVVFLDPGVDIKEKKKKEIITDLIKNKEGDHTYLVFATIKNFFPIKIEPDKKLEFYWQSENIIGARDISTAGYVPAIDFPPLFRNYLIVMAVAFLFLRFSHQLFEKVLKKTSYGKSKKITSMVGYGLLVAAITFVLFLSLSEKNWFLSILFCIASAFSCLANYAISVKLSTPIPHKDDKSPIFIPFAITFIYWVMFTGIIVFYGFQLESLPCLQIVYRLAALNAAQIFLGWLLLITHKEPAKIVAA